MLYTVSWSACGDSGGALGQVDIAPECSASDLTCMVDGVQAPLAVGATVRLAVGQRFRGATAMPTTLESVAPDVLRVEDKRLTGVSQGIAALLILAPGGRVLDFTHLWVVAPTALSLTKLGPQGEALAPAQAHQQLVVGDELRLGAQLLADGQLLSGALALKWELEGEALTSVDPGETGQRRFIARAPGKATIRVRLRRADATGDMSATIALEVLR